MARMVQGVGGTREGERFFFFLPKFSTLGILRVTGRVTQAIDFRLEEASRKSEKSQQATICDDAISAVMLAFG